jgi:hypothetical protein
MLNVLMLNVVMLNVLAECRSAECRSAKCNGASKFRCPIKKMVIFYKNAISLLLTAMKVSSQCYKTFYNRKL